MAFKKLLKVVYDYEAVAEDELNLNEGDFVGVLGDEDEEGWYYGNNLLKDAETSGFIPASYCEEMATKETVQASYEYAAQEENELSFSEGQVLNVLHKIDEDWWLASDEDSGESGMVPANYFTSSEGNESFEDVHDQPTESFKTPEAEEQQEESYYYDDEKEVESEPQTFQAPPPPPPMPNFTENESEQQEQEECEPEEEEIFNNSNPVEELSGSIYLKQICDALFLDSNLVKAKGQMLLEKALYLCKTDSIEHCYDLSELRDYSPEELKLTLKSGEKVAIGLGKKDAKKFSENVKEISGYEPEEEESQKESAVAPPLPKAPEVVGPKIPENYSSETQNAKNAAGNAGKVPMMVGISFEGAEGEEVSIFEGEEVYLLSGEDSTDSQFARIEKINGVQGLVPRAFLITRSEYQKKSEEKAAAAREIEEQQARFAGMNVENDSIVSKVKTESKSTANTATNSTTSVSTNNSTNTKKSTSSSNSPWSALASGSSAVAINNKASNPSNAIKLENSRLWKDRSGKFQVEAEFVSLLDGKVTILKTSGSQVTVPLDILSDRDVEYACKKAGVEVPKKSSNNTNKSGNTTNVKGFDWLAFFLSLGIEAGRSREFGEKFSSQHFEESMISTFTSDFLTAQGMQMSEIYKILPEAAKRKAQAMQDSAKQKHRNNNTQMVLAKPEGPSSSTANNNKNNSNNLVPYQVGSEKEIVSYVPAEEESVEFAKFPTIEELEGIELGAGKSKAKVSLPNGISISKTSTDPSDSSRVIVQPVDAERQREIVTADGSVAKEYTRITRTTTENTIGGGGSNAIALLQQQMQTSAMIQAQAQAQAQAQMQMRMQAQAQAQVQMQMRAQAQAQAQAQYMQQQRMMQAAQMQPAAQTPSVHITINAGGSGDKIGTSSAHMTPPMPLAMNQPMMQMNGGMMAANPMNAMAVMNPMMPMTNPMANPMGNPMNPMNPMNSMMNPFDPTNPFNNGFGF